MQLFELGSKGMQALHQQLDARVLCVMDTLRHSNPRLASWLWHFDLSSRSRG